MRVSLQVTAGTVDAEREKDEVGILWNANAGKRRCHVLRGLLGSLELFAPCVHPVLHGTWQCACRCPLKDVSIFMNQVRHLFCSSILPR